MITNYASVTSLFDRAIIETGRLPEFLFFIALLGTFAFIRTSTHMIRAQVSWWPGNVSVGGTHVHHLVWGIFALLIFGYIGVVAAPSSPWHEIVAVLFAIGAGLTLDEFALWLELKDVYWEKEGRKSIDAMIIAGCLAGMALVGFSAWVDLADDVESAVFAIVGGLGVIGIAVAVTNAAKERYAMAFVGLVFWPGYCWLSPPRQQGPVPIGPFATITSSNVSWSSTAARSANRCIGPRRRCSSVWARTSWLF